MLLLQYCDVSTWKSSSVCSSNSMHWTTIFNKSYIFRIQTSTSYTCTHIHNTHLCTFKFSSLKAHVVVAPKFQDFSWINMNNVYDSESRISTMKGNAAMDATSVFRFKSLLSLSASHAICAKIQTFTIFECVHRFIFIHHSCRLLTTNILYFHLSYKVRLFSLRLDCIVNNNNI